MQTTKLGINYSEIYTTNEVNEVLLGLYNILNLALQIDTSFINIYPYHVVCTLKNGTKETYPPIILPRAISYIDSFDLIMLRDKLVRNRFEIVSRDEKTIFAKVNLEDN